MLRFIYAMLGAIVMAVVGILLNLIAVAVQKNTFADQFSVQTIWELVGLALIGLLIAYWLGKPIQVPTHTSSQVTNGDSADTLSITRLQAFWSRNKLKGKGIHLRNLFQIGGTLDIDTKD